MRQQRERRRDFRRRFMGLLTGGQSGQLLNSGVLSGGRQDPPARRFARDQCRLGSIWESLKEGGQGWGEGAKDRKIIENPEAPASSRRTGLRWVAGGCFPE